MKLNGFKYFERSKDWSNYDVFVFLKKSHDHQCCIYLMKNIVNSIPILNNWARNSQNILRLKVAPNLPI